MYTKDAIRYSLDLADSATQRFLTGIETAPLTFPTANGGCHPLWVFGHLAFVEGLAYGMLTNRENPAQDWAPLFDRDSIASADASRYPSFEQVRDRYTELRRKNLDLLDSMTEADLDKPTPWQPAGLESPFATYAKTLLTVALHQMGHRSHLTDAVRTAGRSVWPRVQAAA